ncbi:glycoside hydrolase family 3 N-terminal domain-containing protein [Streptacidiphilus sp. MAP5-3]|uniref:glycoside hydrolase family 3 N-terminal domain-containing protein n=1 Tax=unclassified Streptacidiphilus TaxID=2643834 RepID=UPI003518AB1A
MTEAARSLSRRGALLAGAGLAAAAAGLASAGPASAASRPAARGALTRLTPRQQAAQRVVFSYPGAAVPQSLLDLIVQGLAGGVILFGDNVTSLAQITAAVTEMKEARRQSPVRSPLLVMTDQEGGEVRRLPGGPTLSQKQIGESANPSAAAADAGRQAGELLRGAGVNVNLAPVLDVFRTPGDFDDEFQRSYSSDPRVAARCGAAFIRAQQAHGVAATAKHFPGLGSATKEQNTDLGPVTLTASRSELRSIDEYPYPPAIDAGVRLVMVSWATYTHLDPDRPAGLSERIVKGELRGRLGFGGVTVTDAINAGALSPFGTEPQNAVSAAQAGMDLILECSRTVAAGLTVVDNLAKALTDDRLAHREFDAAVARIDALRWTLS